MHKIDGAGNDGGRFVHENYETGRPPTEVTADWLNAVQEELLNVIKAGGLPLDKMDNTQVITAINNITSKWDDRFAQILADIEARKAIAMTVNFTGAQTLAMSTLTTLALAPDIVDCDLFSWTAGIFTFKKSGTYRFTSALHFSVIQSTSYPRCGVSLRHIYAKGAGNQTVFSAAPATYQNNQYAVGYAPPATSGSGSAIIPISVDGATKMMAGDQFSLLIYSDTNAPSIRNIDQSSTGTQTLTIEFLGG